MSRFKYAKPADEAGQNEAKRLAMIRKAQGDVIWCVCVCARACACVCVCMCVCVCVCVCHGLGFMVTKWWWVVITFL